jgi:chromosome segregation ATPase
MDNDNQFELLRAMLNQIKADDPILSQLVEEKMNNGRSKIKQPDANKETIRRLRIQNKKLLEQVKLLKDQLKQLTSEKEQMNGSLNYLWKLNNSLSEAVGSCNTCWGEDPDCDICKGNGSPGWRQINKRFFNIYILPGLEKLYGLSKG